jgi:hypothetical protein
MLPYMGCQPPITDLEISTGTEARAAIGTAVSGTKGRKAFYTLVDVIDNRMGPGMEDAPSGNSASGRERAVQLSQDDESAYK